MAVFTFTLDSFQITDTRSRHEDTDYVTYTLLIKAQDGSGTPRMLTKYMGDVNNGVHSVNLSFSNVEVNPTDTVILNYLIVNSGHKGASQITSTIESTASKLATQGGTLLGNAIVPGIGGSLLGAAAGWLAGELLGILTANCDGPVNGTGCPQIQRSHRQYRAGPVQAQHKTPRHEFAHGMRQQFRLHRQLAHDPGRHRCE